MDKLKIVKGNTFETVVEIRAYKYNGEEITDFDLNDCTNIAITNHIFNERLYKTITKKITKYEILDPKRIQIKWDKSTVVGDYSLEMTGKLGDDNWRFYDKKPIFSIVNTNAEANIPQNSIIREDCYQVDKLKLYIICPKGDKGETGNTGPVGPKGDKGDPFTYEDFTQEQLNSLKGKLGDPGNDGQDGSDGKSAYELAVENGYEGTLELWLNSLHGLDGTDGSNGKSAYLSYLDTTSDNPALTEELWIVSLHGADGSAFTYNDFTPTLLAALKGDPGNDGHTPQITASKNNGVTTISVDGTAVATINDGQDGTDGTNGTNGTNGVSPTIQIESITNGHRVTITDISGSNSFDVMDGSDGLDGSVANQIQSNWEETDTSSAAYIQNKPTIPTVPTLATVATSGNYNDLTNTPDLTNYITKNSLVTGLLKDDGTVDTSTYLTSFTEQDPTVPSWAKASSKPSYSYSEISNTPSLATVATTGAYSDLTGTPTIPIVPTNISSFTNDAGYISGIEPDNNNHEYVDLGLPSGRLWAKYNVGENPNAYHLDERFKYFSWGNITGHLSGEYDFGTSNDSEPYVSSNGHDVCNTTITNKSLYDIVYKNMGGSWRFPTKEDYQELNSYCTVTRIYGSGIASDENPIGGLLFTSTINGNTLFFPFTGTIFFSSGDATSELHGFNSSVNTIYFTNSSLGEGRDLVGAYVADTGTGINVSNGTYSYAGHNIRAVLDSTSKINTIGVTLEQRQLLYNSKSLKEDFDDFIDYFKSGAYSPDWNVNNQNDPRYILNKPTIPAAQILADWNQSDSNALDYIKNKPNVSGGNSLSNETAAQGGTTLSAVTTGEKYTWNNKASIWSGTQALYTALSPDYDSNTVYIITAS